MPNDYKNSVLLPRTDFPMRGNLPEREPKMIEAWAKMDDGKSLFEKLREDAAGRPVYTLHDGPPYANGDIHIGHALNKILKDIINRSRQMTGYNAHYVPGWDCHGLPIEWKVEEKYRKAGKDKDGVDTVEFRRECRAFAESWIARQIPQFKRLAIEGDWEHPYKTMNYTSEGQIVRELGKFLTNGGLYRGSKPVLWSVVEKTALADAEVEYYDHKSVTVWVKFPVVESPNAKLTGTALLIWTTTVWTIPGNRAMAFNRDLSYGIYEVVSVGEGSLARIGEKLVVADDLAGQVAAAAKIDGFKRLDDAGDLSGTIAAHPLRGQGFDHDVPVFHGDYVTADAGTGIVHIAPGHGLEDYELAHLQHGIDVPQTVDGAGAFYKHIPHFGGLTVYDSDGKQGTALGRILRMLTEHGGLLCKGSQLHAYPHSWRSKAPLIFRNTSQWFISMETNALRTKALKSLADTAFYPEIGRNRLTAMIETRPDWCVSRQRVWGVPLPIFISKETGEPLRDQRVIDRIASAFDEEGGDIWYRAPASRWLGDDYDADGFEQVKDVVEVWFDSGSTHSFVLEQRPELKWPADLYLEGSDQHRGWFHTSLLESCGTRGRAPYDGVLTHGFVLDGKGNKMSKSLGNTTSPLEVGETLGIDILRLWVVASDYSGDLRISPDILKHQADAYRRFRNTLRFILGNLNGYRPADAVDVADMPEPERYVLHRLGEISTAVRKAVEAYDFHGLYTMLHNFCAVELSAQYFDIRKDSLYCDARDNPGRRATQTVLATLFSALTSWLAPILAFTAEEAYLARQSAEKQADTADGMSGGLAGKASVHLEQYPDFGDTFAADGIAAKWSKLFEIRRVVTGALELKRNDKTIGSGLQAAPVLYADPGADPDLKDVLSGVALADVFITSGIELKFGAVPDAAFTLDDVAGIGVIFALAAGQKCERCWKILPEVGSHAVHPTLCGRCADVFDASGKA